MCLKCTPINKLHFNYSCYEQSSGGRYRVQTGRKDGLVSNAADVNLPGPTISVSQSRQIFANKGLGLTDMVLLLGTFLISSTSNPNN